MILNKIILFAKILFFSFKKEEELLKVKPIIEKAQKNKIYSSDKIENITDWVIALRRRLDKVQTCYTRSLLLRYSLNYYGIKSRICFGAKKSKKLNGHCWITYNGNKKSKSYKIIYDI